MPALPRNPSSMTKEKLADELRKNGIPVPKGRSKKEVYVELYERHLLTGQSSSPQWVSYRNMSVNTTPAKLGFSSDEDDDVAVTKARIKKKPAIKQLNVNNNRSQRKAVKKASGNEFEDRLAEVEGLSDGDLRKELQARGVKPGPIVASTRSVYERKLADLLLQPVQEQQPEQQQEYEEEEEDLSQEEAGDDEDGDSQENDNHYSDSDVDGEEVVETQPTSRLVSSKTTSSYKSQVTRLIDQESSTKACRRSVTPQRKTEMTSSSTETVTKTTSTHQKKEERGKPLVPVWLQILIFLIVAAFLALIWYNMETGQPESPLVT